MHNYIYLTAVKGRLKAQKIKSETARERRKGVVDCFFMLTFVIRMKRVSPLPTTPRTEQTIADLRPYF